MSSILVLGTGLFIGLFPLVLRKRGFGGTGWSTAVLHPHWPSA